MIVSGAPTYMVHDPRNRQFLINSNDADSEEFEITVIGSIQYATDFTNSNFETVEESFTFLLVVDNPVICPEATINPFVLNDMSVFAMGISAEQSLPTVTDSAEGECGAIAYEIINEEAYADYLAFDPSSKKLVLESSDRSNIG